MTRFLPLIYVFGVAPLACGQGDARFETRFASDFAPPRHAVSVFAVFKDGRMSSAPWTTLSPHLKVALGQGACDIGYDGLLAAAPKVAEAVDDYSQQNGPTDELLARLAAAAQGDLVLIVTLAGRLPEKTAFRGVLPPKDPSGGGRGAYGRRGIRPPSEPRDTNALDIVAAFYSVSQGRTVAEVALEYSGDNLDLAMSQFGAKLAQSLPEMRCAGWAWDKPIEPDSIRRIEP